MGERTGSLLIKVAALFRISKGDDQIERRDPADEAADQPSSSAGSGSNVAVSALRWLRKSPKTPEPESPADKAEVVREIGFFRPAAGEAEDEEFELEGPLDKADPDVGDGETDQPRETRQAPDNPVPTDIPDEAVKVLLADDQDDMPFEFDDGDDLDDFDDLGDLEALLTSRPPENPSFFSNIDLDEDKPTDGLEDPFPPSADHNGAEAQPDETQPDETEEEPAPFDERADDQAGDSRKPDDFDAVGAEPVLEEPILQKPSKSPELEGKLDPPELQEAPVVLLETSLALQPIPELQSNPASSVAALPEGDEEDAETVDLFDDGVDLDNDEPDDDDDLPVSSNDADAAELDMLDLDVLELDPLEMDTSDQPDDQIADDWHAHMADVLAGNGAPDESISSKYEAKTQAPERIETSKTLLPLSKTLAQLAATSDPKAEVTEPVTPSFMTRTTRQKTAASQPPSTLPADGADLSPAQLSLGIITNVPRLRRFAAVQIGDELVADQLVQNTIETALANPSLLQDSSDLGLALIALLHRHRREMLTIRSSAPERSLEAARAFETALCRGLAGADQFEIHQFAQAINGLDERDRELLVLVALENLAYGQIADVIQVPTVQVMSMISDARMRLRRALAIDETGTDSLSSAIDTPHSQEIEIHGYLDGELDGHHMADVDALVEYDEDAADRLLQYGIQGDLIRRLYAPLINRPVPAKMLDAHAAAAKPARRGFGFGSRRALIAGAVMTSLGSAVFWPYLLS